MTGGGSYALSDVEIVPGVDQNGGWSWDAGLRVGRGAASLGLGYQRLRLDIGPGGTGTISAAYAEPRLGFGRGMWGVQPYLFARGARIFDYDVSFCCSAYPANSNADGWIAGGGFGAAFAPIGTVRFDLSAGVQRLLGESDETNFGSWKGAGPMIDVRLGASIPLTRGYGMR
ncbi:MAG TPA: hypothetical protein VM076_13075 [Gemmatimonadaceae bacterium]|nr:hypothetical protein [Gemmatimonadaceae bacterium]